MHWAAALFKTLNQGVAMAGFPEAVIDIRDLFFSYHTLEAPARDQFSGPQG
jgi:hypothetical protein